MLTGSQIVKKFPAFYGTRMFITAFTRFRQLSLTWARWIQSMPHPNFWRSILILSSHLRLGLPSGRFPWRFPTKTLYIPLLSPYVLHAPPISFFSMIITDQSMSASLCEWFVTWYVFIVKELLAPPPTSKLEDHPLSAVCDYFFSIFAATLLIWRSFLHPQREDAPWRGGRDPLIMATDRSPMYCTDLPFNQT